MQRLMISAAIAAALLPAQRQPAADQLAVIRGRVLNAASGEPVRKAQVTLRPLTAGASGGPARVTVGEDGSFVLSSITPGKYDLSASRTGFIGQGYGAPPANIQGPPVILAAGQSLENVTIRMVPQGVLAGRVIDSDGDPVERAEIALWRWEYPDGERQLVRQPLGGIGTNDLGEYRISRVPPGSYIVSATAPLLNSAPGKESSDSDLIATYFPRSPDAAGAAAIEVAAGSELRGVDIQILKSTLFQVRGTLTGVPPPPAQVPAIAPGGGGPPRPTVNLISLDSATLGRSGTVNPDGSFVIAQVAPGSYTLQANARDGQQPLAARTSVQVSGRDVDGIALTLQPLVRVSGTVLVDPPSARKPQFTSLRLLFRSAALTGRTAAAVGSDGTLQGQAQLFRDVYRLDVSDIPDGFYLKSVKLGGQEARDAMLDLASNGSAEARVDLTLAPTSAALSGTVSDAQGAPVSGVKVTVVPASDATRRDLFLSRDSDSNGAFSFKNLPPGKYRVYAWRQVEGNAWMNAEFRKPYESSAAAAEITDNTTVSVMLNLIEAAR